ncbi:MAG: hypothetical protein RL455_307, partial [Actinomycetota bacterium]
LSSLGVVHPTFADGATPTTSLRQITPVVGSKYDQTPLEDREYACE